jgi:Uma2 family endonuclease
MTTLIAPPLPPPVGLVAPHPRRWTKAEYHKLRELGWFEWQHVELLDGEIIQMPNAGHPHCVSNDKVRAVLEVIFPKDRHWLRAQSALNLGLDVEPQPDIAVADGPMESFNDHPTTALLVVEVSDTTLSIDRGWKAGIYARGGIEDYWIVNVNARQLEVHRRPVRDATAEGGYRYDEKTILGEADSVSPLAAPQALIRVADLLP